MPKTYEEKISKISKITLIIKSLVSCYVKVDQKKQPAD